MAVYRKSSSFGNTAVKKEKESKACGLILETRKKGVHSLPYLRALTISQNWLAASLVVLNVKWAFLEDFPTKPPQQCIAFYMH